MMIHKHGSLSCCCDCLFVVVVVVVNVVVVFDPLSLSRTLAAVWDARCGHEHCGNQSWRR